MTVPNRVFIENFELDVPSGELVSGNNKSHLSLKAVEVLVFLINNSGQLVSREQIHAHVWKDRIVTDAQISKAISELRVAFEDTSEPHRIIQTLPRRGYRLIADAKLEHSPKRVPEHKTPEPEPEKEKAARKNYTFVLLGLFIVLALAYLGVSVLNSTTESAVDVRPGIEARPVVYPLTSIGVLPFDDLSSDGQHAWLASAFTAELIESLSRTPEFMLPGRNSLKLLKQQQSNLATIASTLKVGALIEGSVQYEDERLRVIVQLVRISDGLQIWSARYDEELTSVFKTQSQISVSIAEAIRAELGLNMSDTSPLRYARYEPKDGRAYEIVSKVSEQMRSIGDWTSPGQRILQRETLEQALSIDPDYPIALVIKAYDMLNSDIEQAHFIAQSVLAKQEDYWQAIALLGAIAWLNNDWLQVDKHMQRALELAPWSGQLHRAYAEYLQYMFRFEEAEKHAVLALKLDPLLPFIQFTRAMTDFHAGKYISAVGFLQMVVDSGDSSPSVMSNLHRALHLSGRDSEASGVLLDLWSSIPPMKKRLEDQPLLKQHLENGRYQEFIIQAFELYPVDCAANANFAEIRASVLAETKEKELMYSCLEKAQKAGYRIRLFDYRFKPYWNENRFKLVLASYKLDGYLPAE